MGDKWIRRMLYMGVLGASRGNNAVRTRYQHLANRGKAKTLAIVATACKWPYGLGPFSALVKSSTVIVSHQQRLDNKRIFGHCQSRLSVSLRRRRRAFRSPRPQP